MNADGTIEFAQDCLSLAQAINSATSDWRTARTAALAAWASVFASGLKLSNGALTFTMPDPGTYDAILELALVNAEEQNVKLNFLAAEYTQFGCFNNTWTDATPDLNLPMSSSMTNSCDIETWQVSDDGGATWYDQDFEVCEEED